MIQLFSVNKEDSFCSIVIDSLSNNSVRLLELIEQNNINLWCDNIRKLHQSYNILHQYYLGSEENLKILKLVSPDNKKLIYERETEDLRIDKLIKKLGDNLIVLSEEWEHLKWNIFDDDIKLECLKLIGSVNYYRIEEKLEPDGIFKEWEPKKEDKINNCIPFEAVSLESVLKLFE